MKFDFENADGSCHYYFEVDPNYRRLWIDVDYLAPVGITKYTSTRPILNGKILWVAHDLNNTEFLKLTHEARHYIDGMIERLHKLNAFW